MCAIEQQSSKTEEKVTPRKTGDAREKWKKIYRTYEAKLQTQRTHSILSFYFLLLSFINSKKFLTYKHTHLTTHISARKRTDTERDTHTKAQRCTHIKTCSSTPAPFYYTNTILIVVLKGNFISFWWSIKVSDRKFASFVYTWHPVTFTFVSKE